MLILNPISNFIFNNIKDSLESGVIGLLLMIDGIVYWLISKLFSLYTTLAAAKILKANAFDEIKGNIYLFIGILALFFLAFSLLKAMVNPDELNKGSKKIAINLITSILLLTFIPTIFDYAFDFQNAIFEENIIGKIFTGSEVKSDDEMPSVCYGNSNSSESNEPVTITTFQLQGNQLAMAVLEAFVVTSGNTDPENSCGTVWSNAKKYMIYSGEFDYISTFVENIVSESPTMGYRFIVSTICGGFLVYILLSFCLDMGIRVVKMAFLQVIAPIPIIMRIAPSKEGQFNKWVNITLSTYVEVFVRIIIINLVIYIASTILDDTTMFYNNGTGLFGQVIIILGLFAFAKQAPKLISDLLGFESGGVNLGIKKKLTEVPIAGKGFTAAYGVANKVKGAATGAVGGLEASLMNGAGTSGFQAGLIDGWKRGGNQLNTQRKAVYSSYGLKGNPGLFGGQSKIEAVADDIKKSASKAANESIRESIKKYESQDKFMRVQEEQSNILKAQHQQLYNNLVQKINDVSRVYDEEDNRIRTMQETARVNYENAQSQLATLRQDYDTQKSQFETNKADRIKSLMEEKSRWHNVPAKVAEFESQIENLKNQQFENQELTNKIKELSEVKYNHIEFENMLSNNNIRRENDSQLDALKEQLDDQAKYLKIDSDALKAEAHAAARKIISEKDTTYGNRVSAVAKKDAEAEIKAYRDSIEGQKAIAVQTQAFENYEKRNKNKDKK